MIETKVFTVQQAKNAGINGLINDVLHVQYKGTQSTDELGNPVELPMGDRFYAQQLAATGSAVGSKSKPAKAKKLTKADLVCNFPKDVPAAGFEKLVMDDLQKLHNYVCNPVRLLSHTKPEDKVRLKQPWVECIKGITGLEIDWAKLTIADIKAFYAYLTQGMD